jgi:hypothetical protein
MLGRLDPPSPVQPGDLLLRPKDSGLGFHYGTGISGGYVAHTMPRIGKHVSTFDEFGDNRPVAIFRPPHSPVQNYLVEQAALSDLGKPYNAWTSNCEHDVFKAHSGNAQSPTINSIAVLSGVVFVIGLFKAFSDE